MATNTTRYKPYTIRGEPSATMMEQIDEMFGLLFQDLEINETSDLLSASLSDVEAGSPVEGAFIVGNTDSPSEWAVLDTDVLFIDETNVRLGIGTAAPSTTLHVKRGDAGTEPTWTTSDVAIFEDTSGTNTALQLFSSNAAICGIGFSDPDARSVGGFNYRHSTDSMDWTTNSTVKLVLSAGGQLGIGSGIVVADIPSGPTLHIREGSGGTDPTWSASDTILVESDGTAALSFFTPATQVQSIVFSDTTRNAGNITYSHVTDAMSFRVNASDRLTITSAGLCNFSTDASVGILDTGADHYMRLDYGENATADRTLSVVLGNTNRTLTFAGDSTISNINSGDVTLAGTPDYITISAQVITRGLIDLATDITGVLPVANGGTAVSSATQTYTPTRSAEVNLDANVTPSEAQYLRVGNTVTVSGRFTADPTLNTTATSFELSLPVASNIGAVEDLAGVAFCGAIAGQGAEISGSVANDTAVISWIATDVTSQSWAYIYSYQVI